jgi:uncharacterized protein (UPF0371 family)
VVTGTGPGSGKMSTCLCQLYHDHRNGLNSGYAKFETFPIWNLPVEHPVNVAYEAATADLGDIVMVDSFHLEAYGETATNYNRDIENFPILKTIIDRIAADNGQSVRYQSPTDMGVNRAARGSSTTRWCARPRRRRSSAATSATVANSARVCVRHRRCAARSYSWRGWASARPTARL